MLVRTRRYEILNRWFCPAVKARNERGYVVHKISRIRITLSSAASKISK